MFVSSPFFLVFFKILSIWFILSSIFVTRSLSTPSIFYNPDFDAREDAVDIHHAVKGPGTDEGLLLEIITDRTCPQRLEIKQAFQDIYNYDLPKRLGEDTSGTYEQLLRDSFICGDEIYVQHLWRALHNENKNHNQKHADKSVIEILIIYSETNEKRQALLDGYQKLYNTPLVDDLKKAYGSGNFLDAAIQVATPRNRALRDLIDEKAAHDVGEALSNESANWNDYHDFLTKTLLETSLEQLTSTLHAFQKKNGKDIAAVVKKKMKEPMRNLYQDLITFVRWYANSHREYYAIRLKESVDGPGTHESALIRTILYHSETDMKELEDQFRINYTRELRSKIAHDTSGDFEALLKAFLPRTPAEEAEKRKKREEFRRKQKERKKIRMSLGLAYQIDMMEQRIPNNPHYSNVQGMMVNPYAFTNVGTSNHNMMVVHQQNNVTPYPQIRDTRPLIPNLGTMPYVELIRYEQDDTRTNRFNPYALC